MAPPPPPDREEKWLPSLRSESGLPHLGQVCGLSLWEKDKTSFSNSWPHLVHL